jgi:hypothetical protein
MQMTFIHLHCRRHHRLAMEHRLLLDPRRICPARPIWTVAIPRMQYVVFSSRSRNDKSIRRPYTGAPRSPIAPTEPIFKHMDLEISPNLLFNILTIFYSFI